MCGATRNLFSGRLHPQTVGINLDNSGDVGTVKRFAGKIELCLYKFGVLLRSNA